MANPIPFLLNTRKFEIIAIEHYENVVSFLDNDMLRLASLFKVYIFLRALLTRTIFYSQRAYRVNKIFNIELDYHFVLKCVMRHSPFVIALGWMFLGMLMFGYAI